MFIKFTEKIEKELKNNRRNPIIVEGKKDKRVLSILGFQNVIDISGKSLDKVVNKINSDGPVLILTDFDKEGEEKASQLIKLLQKNNLKVNSFTRNRFRNLFRIHKIEEFNSFIKIMEDDYYGKTCSIYDKIFNRSRFFLRRNYRKARRNRGDIRSDRRSSGS